MKLSGIRMERLTISGVALLLSLVSASCTTMRPISLEEISVEAPERVRVTTGQDVISIADPRIDEGTLGGELLNGRNQRTGLNWSTPVDSILEVAIRTRAQGRTAVAVILGIPAAAFAIFLIAFLDHCDSQPSPCG